MSTASSPADAGADPSGGPAPGTRRRRTGAMAGAQRIGRSLMLPIATLPAAALMVRLGQQDLLGRESLPPAAHRIAEFLAKGGGALLENLPLLFAVGIAVGFARKSDGSTALAAVVGWLVFDQVMTAFQDTARPPSPDGSAAPADAGVLGGVVMGLVVALLYQRFHRTRLPDWLGFFGGRRLVPILASFAGLLLGVAFGYLWPVLGGGLARFGEWLVGSGAWGAGLFGAANRALIPVGMHHLLNSFPWFQAGSYTVDGQTHSGDIARFLHGDPSAGQFMTGFFPIMMFALPAACLAITHCARPARRKAVGGMMFSVALTAFVTGVTEPIEFTFMFVAPALYVMHALLTGVALALTWALGMKDGFGFSAGFLDYVLNFGIATKPLLLIPVGLGFAVVYYSVFRFAIMRFDLPTPGRAPDEEDGEVKSADPGTRAEPAAARPRGAEPIGAGPREAEPREAEPREAEPREAEPIGAEPREAEPIGAEPIGAGPRGAGPAPGPAGDSLTATARAPDRDGPAPPHRSRPPSHPAD